MPRDKVALLELSAAEPTTDQMPTLVGENHHDPRGNQQQQQFGDSVTQAISNVNPAKNPESASIANAGFGPLTEGGGGVFK